MTGSRLSKHRADLVAVLSIALIVTGLYLPRVLAGKTLLDNPALLDVSIMFYPDVHWGAVAWRHGEFPLWNPHSTCGTPLLGYTATGAMYPLTVLFYGLLPYLLGASIGIIFHSLAAALLMFLMLRQIKAPPAAAAAGGLIFVFSGMFFGSLYMISQQGSLCWALALMISFRALIERPTTARFFGLAGSLALAALSGAPEVFAFGAITAGLTVFLERPWETRRWPRLIMLYGLPVAAGVLVALPFFLAATVNAHFSLRGPLMPFEVKIPSLPPQWPIIIPTWLFPFKYFTAKMGAYQDFNHGLSPLYQGAFFAPALLVALAGSGKDRISTGLSRTFVVLLLYIILSHSPWTRALVERIPLLGMLRVPTKAVCYLEVVGLMLIFRRLSLSASAEARASRLAFAVVLLLGGAAIMAAQPWCLGGMERYVVGALALGLGAAFTGGAIRRSGTFSGSRLLLVFALMMALEILLMAGRSIPGTDPESYRLPRDLRGQRLDLGGGTRYAMFEQLLPTSTSDPAPLYGIFQVATGGCNFSGTSRIYPAWQFLYQSLINGEYLETIGGGERYLNMWSLGNPGTIRRDRMHLFNLTGVRLIVSRDLAVPFTSPYSLLKPNALLLNAGVGSMELENQPARMKMTGPTSLEARLYSLPGDRLALAGRADAPGTGLLRSRGANGTEGELLLAREVTPLHNLSLSVPLDTLRSGGNLSLAWEPRERDEARIEFTRLAIENPARPFQRFFEAGGIELFTNRDALPRAFVVHEARVVADLAAEMKEVADPGKFSPHRVVILNAPLAGTDAPAGASTGPSDEAVITTYHDNRVEMTARSRTPGFLVFTDTYFPGWKARINQGYGWEQTPIARADLAFRAIRVPAGLTRIQWTYEPASFRIGLWAALAALGALVFAAAIRLQAGIRKKRFTPPHPA